MNDLKRKIHLAATPPPPLRKEKFIRSLPVKYADFHEFVLMQPKFIRKRVWCVSVLFTLAAALGVKISGVMFTSRNMSAIWLISTATPFFALTAVCELFSSDEFGMSEIENACRFGKGQLVAARILIIGILTFVVMTVVTLTAGIFTPLGIGQAVMYILAPYSLAAGLFMEILSRIRGKNGLYVCVASAAFIGIAGVFTKSLPDYVYILTIVLGVLFMIANTVKILKDGEFYGAYN